MQLAFFPQPLKPARPLPITPYGALRPEVAGSLTLSRGIILMLGARPTGRTAKVKEHHVAAETVSADLPAAIVSTGMVPEYSEHSVGGGRIE